MTEGDHNAIEDRLYEAALVPELWPDLLQFMSDKIDAAGAIIFGSTDMVSRSLASPGVQSALKCFMDDGWYMKNSRAEMGWRRGLHLLPRFVTEYDYFEGDDYERDKTYLGYFRPQGLGWSAGTVFHLPNGDALTVSFEKAYSRGAVDTRSLALLDTARPHMARSVMLGARLAFERARSALETLNALGIPAFAVTRSGKLAMANEVVLEAPQFWTTRFGDKLAFFDRRADMLFHEALSTGQSGSNVRSFPVFGVDPDTKAIAHVVPIRRAARDLFGSLAAIGVLSLPRREQKNTDISILQALFDLTPTEAEIANELAAGLNTDQISRRDGRNRFTVRTHVKRIMAKVGCSNQNELVYILSNITR